jgi:hypothetical protein
MGPAVERVNDSKLSLGPGLLPYPATSRVDLGTRVQSEIGFGGSKLGSEMDERGIYDLLTFFIPYRTSPISFPPAFYRNAAHSQLRARSS